MIFIASRWFSIGFSIGFNKVSWFHMIPKSEKTILLDLGFSFPWVSYGPWSAEVAMIAGCVTELGTLNSRVDSSAGHGGGWWWWFDGRCHCCHCSPRTAYFHSVAFKAWKSSNNALLFCIHIFFTQKELATVGCWGCESKWMTYGWYVDMVDIDDGIAYSKSSGWVQGGVNAFSRSMRPWVIGFSGVTGRPKLSSIWKHKHFWLVVWTPLKNISQWEGLSLILRKIKNVWNHQSDFVHLKTNPVIFGVETPISATKTLW